MAREGESRDPERRSCGNVMGPDQHRITYVLGGPD